MNLIKKIYFRTTGYSYTNLGRLFLRLFVGVMFMQFGVRQLYNFDTVCQTFPSVAGLSPEVSLIVMIAVEIGCSLFIMVGFLTRLMTFCPLVSMILALIYQLRHPAMPHPYLDTWQQPLFIPMLFMGIYFFLLIVGPGKISIDYFLSLHFIHSEDKSEEEELEEV